MNNRQANRPVELLRQLAEAAYVHPMIAYDFGRNRKPGAAILALPEHQRALLRQLKADDIKDDRWMRPITLMATREISSALYR